MKRKLENFAKKYGLTFSYYTSYPSTYIDMYIHYNEYLLNVAFNDYWSFSIYNGHQSEHYLDLKSALKAFRKIMKGE